MKEDKINEIEVTDAEVITPEEPKKELTLEETKEAVASLRNIPYVKILDSEGNVVNPINGNYPNYFANRKQRRDGIKAETRNPKNNKKGTRLVVTQIGDLNFVKTEVKKQRVDRGIERTTLNSDGTITKGTKIHKARTIVHNKIKNN